MNKVIVIIVLFISSHLLKAQDPRNLKSIDIAIAVGGGFSPAVGFQKMFGIGQNGKFKIGYGLRYTCFVGKDLHFRTAPASLTSGKSSLVALFSDDITSQIDTLHLSKVQTNALNLNIQLEYAITKKLDVGFNIDAIGLTFGGSKNGIFTANASDSQGKSNNGKSFAAKPTGFNLLLISDSDIGTLNSEMYARYWVSEKNGVRFGASFQFLEYTAEKQLAFNNDRFRSKQLLPFIAFTHKF
jgi:hypothetical protein